MKAKDYYLNSLTYDSIVQSLLDAAALYVDREYVYKAEVKTINTFPQGLIRVWRVK